MTRHVYKYAARLSIVFGSMFGVGWWAFESNGSLLFSLIFIFIALVFINERPRGDEE